MCTVLPPSAGQHFRAFSHFKHPPFPLGSIPAFLRAGRNTVKPTAAFCKGRSQRLQQSSSSSGQAAGTHSIPQPQVSQLVTFCHSLPQDGQQHTGYIWAILVTTNSRLVAESDFTLHRGKQTNTTQQTPTAFCNRKSNLKRSIGITELWFPFKGEQLDLLPEPGAQTAAMDTPEMCCHPGN